MNNKSHLVDSLGVSILGYPIVLSTDKINKDQVNSIYNKLVAIVI